MTGANTNSLIAMDLFSGCGGLTLGLKQAGFNVLGAVDLDPLSVETYRSNHPEVKIWEGDIRDLPAREVMKRLGLRKGDLDLLAGCPPCQGFSSMRTLNGGRTIDDPRNELIFEFLRFVTELRPKAVMMENVPGLEADSRCKEFCAELRTMGYMLKSRVLNAADFGVPQRRRRLIILAALGGAIEPADPDSKRRNVRDAIAHLPPAGCSGDPLHDLPESRGSRIVALIKRIPRNGGSRCDLDQSYQLPCHTRCSGFKDVYGRMTWEALAPTITSGCTNPSKGRFLHPEHDRAITLREAALLQTFPGDYRFSLRRGKQGVSQLIGNALPPEFIRRHADQVYRFLITPPRG